MPAESAAVVAPKMAFILALAINEEAFACGIW
jgi:hypothetical protein